MALVIKPFNGVFFALIAIIILSIVLITLLLKNKSEKTKRIFILGLAVFNIIYWIMYKVWLYRGVEVLNKTGYTFDIFKELPLHLCNIALFLIIIGVLAKSNFCNSYCVYVSIIGAILALCSPTYGFFDSSLLELHNLGYYGTHAIIIINGCLLITLGLFKPSYKNAIFSFLMLSLLALAMHGINQLIYTQFGHESDYFYTMHFYNISLLNVFWNIIPIRFIYLIPPFIAYGILTIILTVPFQLSKVKRN